jgi:opacity protein-like surface antigen
MRHAIRLQLAGALLALSVIPAAAQVDESRLRVSAGAAATTGTGSQDPAWTASFGYRFAERLSFDVDFTQAQRGFAGRDVPIPYPVTVMPANIGVSGIPTSIATPGRGGAVPGGIGYDLRAMPNLGGLTLPARLGDVDSDTSIVTLGVRYELPITGGRLRPYVAGGLGLARTQVDIEYPAAWLAAVSSPMFPGGNTIPGYLQNDSATRTTVAASGGFGASLRVFKGISADMDVRYFRFDHAHMARLGGGVSYRF